MDDDPSPVLERGRLTQILAWLVWALVVGLVLAGLATIPADDPLAAATTAAALLAALSLSTSGAVLVSRLPRHPIGWLLLGGGLFFVVANVSGPVAPALLPGAPAAAGWVLWLGALMWTPAIVCVAVVVPLLFPTGSLPSSRWRVVVVVGVLAVILSTISVAFSPFTPGSVPPGIANPLAVSGAPDFLGLLGAISSLSGVVCLPLVAISLVMRYRHASGIERAQLKWFAAVVAVLGPAFAIGISLGQATVEPWRTVGETAWLLTAVGLALLPVAIGIAVLRYHLYDIDLIIRRTVVYVPLTAILAGVYAASIALLQRLFIAATGGPSDGAVILSTLILATTFTPIRGWLQGIVDRRFRDAQDAERQLDRFISVNATATWALDRARTLHAFLTVAVKAMEATGGIAYVETPHGERVAGRAGSAAGATVLTVPVAVGGHRLGRLDLEPRRRGRPYSEHDVAIVEQAAEHVAAIILGLVDEPVMAGVIAEPG